MNRLTVLVVFLVAVQAMAQTAPATPPAASPAAPATGAPAATATATTTTSTAPATASAGSAVLTPEQLAMLSGFFFSFSVDHLLGLGTFVDPQLYANLSANINAFISYRTRLLGKAFSIGFQPFGLLGFSYEYTLPDAANGRRWSWSDARVALSMPALIKEKNTGIVITPSFNVIVPTTIESWGAGLISRLGFGLSMNKNFKTPIGTIIANFGGLGTIGLYTNSQSVVRPTTLKDPAGHQLVLCRTGETACGINNNNSFLALQGSLNVTWVARDGIFLTLGYGMQTSFLYAAATTVDEFTPPTRDTNGNPVARTGMSRSDTQSASVSLSFNLTNSISGTLYLFNFAPLLTADNKSVRFPLIDVTGLANNNTAVGFSLSATY
ncbi:MAG: hypothetical protein Q8S42_36030 [Archangium sp.]|nr:hypothetical protein [Archangium sp.]